MGPSVHTRVLQRAAEILGGFEALRRFLGVPAPVLESWMAGRVKVPDGDFLKAVDVVIEGDLPSRTPASARALHYERRTRGALAASAEAIQESRRLYKAILSGGARLWDPEFFATSDRQAVLDAALDAALQLTDASKGSVQLLERDGAALRIAAQRGFERPFLEFFAEVRSGDGGAWGSALAGGRRVIVADVAASDLFLAEGRRVMLQAQALAVVATPFVGSSGRALGVLSTHYPRPCAPSPGEEHMLDLVAQRTASWLEQRAG